MSDIEDYMATIEKISIPPRTLLMPFHMLPDLFEDIDIVDIFKDCVLECDICQPCYNLNICANAKSGKDVFGGVRIESGDSENTFSMMGCSCWDGTQEDWERLSND